MAPSSNQIVILATKLKNILFQLAVVVSILYLPEISVAQEQALTEPLPEIMLYHSPPYNSDNMLPAGRKFAVSVDLFNTESIEEQMKLHVVTDGVLQEVPPQRIFINTHDRPEYVFELFSPLVELSYQFTYYPKGAPPLQTERFEVRRSCKPKMNITNVNQEITSQGQQRLNEIVYRARALEQEINTYTEVNSILKAIRNEFALLDKE